MLIKNFYGYWLNRYDKADFIRYKKAEFLLSMNILFILLLAALSIVSMKLPWDRYIILLAATLPSITIALISFFFIKSGKENISGIILSVMTSFVIVGGFVTRPPYLSGVSLGQFMYVGLVFSVLFCSLAISSATFIFFAGTHIVYFIVVTMGQAANPVSFEAGRTLLMDGLISIIMVFSITLALSRLLNRAIRISREESEKNRSQYDYISSLIDTIKNTSDEMTGAIGVTSQIITKYSDNARSQAASVEQLSATVEEIASTAENVSQATTEQGGSIGELLKSIDDLSKSIDSVKFYGNEISDQFVSFMKLAEGGKESSSTLDEINQKILGNSNQILNVTDIMKDFFDQINLLSLNAAIEAARAGDYGRGFAVVADEIGKLADQSSSELKQVNDLIMTNRKDVDKGSKIISDIVTFIQNMLSHLERLQQKAIVTIKEISHQEELKNAMDIRTGAVREKSQLIETAMSEQESAINDVLKSIDETNRIVQDNAQSTEELVKNSVRLGDLADRLRREFENTER